MNAVVAGVGPDLVSRAVEELGALGYTFAPSSLSAGAWLRIPAAGKHPSNRAAAVKLAPDGRAVHLVDHASGLRHTVRIDDVGLTAAERARIRIEARRVRRVQQVEQDARERRGTGAAVRIWEAATPALEHAYLAAKRIRVEGLRVDEAGELLVPRVDVDGALVGLQRIAPTSKGATWPKRYAAGAPTRGTFFMIGTVNPSSTVVVAEGLATGATVHVETGHPCAVAFDAGNLAAVAMALRAKYRTVRIVVCGDDDRQTVGNPGRTKAVEAARAVDGAVALPPLCRTCCCTDFNDLAACEQRRSGS